MLPTLTVDTAFPGGGADRIRVERDTIAFCAPLRNCPQAMWWWLRVGGGGGRRVTFHLENVDRILGGRGLGNAQPVVRAAPGQPWERVAVDDCELVWDEHRFTFTATLPSDHADVAWCYPYQAADLDHLLERLAAHPHLEAETLCRSARGRSVPRVTVTDPAAEGRKALIVLTARQHAGEVPGSYALEGLLRALLADGAADLRQRALFLIVPMMDVDGVEEGSYGKDQEPVDFNRDWTARAYHPAVAAAQDAIAAAAQRHDYRLFLDLHAPAPGDASFLVPTGSAWRGEADWAAAWSLGAAIEAAAPDDCPVFTRDYPPGCADWSNELSECVASTSNALRHDIPSATLEIAYHRASNGSLMTPDGWRALGAGLLRALDAWLTDPPAPAPVPRPVPQLERWIVRNRPRGVELSEQPDALTLTPTGDDNRCVVEPRARRPVDGPVEALLETALAAPADVSLPLAVNVYFYAADGRRLPEYEPRRIEASGGRTIHRLLIAAPSDAAAWRAGIAVHGLPAPLTLRWPGGPEPGA